MYYKPLAQNNFSMYMEGSSIVGFFFAPVVDRNVINKGQEYEYEGHPLPESPESVLLILNNSFQNSVPNWAMNSHVSI